MLDDCGFIRVTQLAKHAWLVVVVIVVVVAVVVVVVAVIVLLLCSCCSVQRRAMLPLACSDHERSEPPRKVTDRCALLVSISAQRSVAAARR